jgi:N-acetylglucosamine-6-phosphate deacetylase
MSSIITARRLLMRTGNIEYPVVRVDNGHIASIRGADQAPPSGPGVHAYPDALLIPSFIDIHVHGAAGHDVMEGSSQSLRAIEAFLASHGVGAFFPTTVTSSVEVTLRALDRLANEIGKNAGLNGAAPLGIHLEGPFLSHAKRGVHPSELLLEPSIALFDRFWQAARGHIRLLTIAPELTDALDLIEHATALGVRCSLGHSDATLPQAKAGFQAGARSATHTFNAMRALDHRDPGIAAYVLDNDDMFAEIICDGIHVDPAMVRLFFKAKNSARSILVTDGIAATGMPDGQYKLGDLEVEVSQGRCTLVGAAGGNVLAGSVLTLDRAVRNFAAFTCSDLSSIIPLATENPARLMDLADRWGALEEGREANLTVVTEAGEVVQSFRSGHPILA